MKNLIKDHSVIMSQKFRHPSSPLLCSMYLCHKITNSLSAFPQIVWHHFWIFLWCYEKLMGEVNYRRDRIYLNNGLFVRYSGPIWWPVTGQNCPLFRCHVHIRQVTKNINSGLVRLIESEYSGVMNTGFVWWLSVWNSRHDLYASLELESLYIFFHVTDHGSIS